MKADELYEYALNKAVDKLLTDQTFRKDVTDRAVKAVIRDVRVIAAVLATIDNEDIAKRVADFIVKEYLRTNWKGKNLVNAVQKLAQKEAQKMLANSIRSGL